MHTDRQNDIPLTTWFHLTNTNICMHYESNEALHNLINEHIHDKLDVANTMAKCMGEEKVEKESERGREKHSKSHLLVNMIPMVVKHLDISNISVMNLSFILS